MNEKTRRTDDGESNGTSRRRVLKAVGAGAVAVGVGGTGLASAATRQDKKQGKKQADIQLGGKVAGWQGMKPKSVKGKKNPTLNLQTGKTYTLWWKNLDGQPHDFALQDGDGNNLKVIEGDDGKKKKTELVQEKGATQTLQFTPTKKVKQYVCTVHPTTMVGDVKFGGNNVIKPSGGSGGGGGGGGNGGNG